MISTAIVGLGKMGLSHLALFNTHPEVRIAAVCDSSGLVLRALQKQTGVEVFKDYRDMIQAIRPACVVVSTPTSTHTDIARYAIDQGAHVFLEKPFSLAVEEGQALVQLARERGVVNQVGYPNRFNAVFSEVRRLLAGGAIGQLNHYAAEMYGNVPVGSSGNNWRSRRSEGGGCLYDYGSHCIDLVNYLLGPPREVAGTVFRHLHSPQADDVVRSQFLHENGLAGHFVVDWCDVTQRRAFNRIVVWGTEGRIEADKSELRVFLKRGPFEPYVQGWNVRYATDLARPVRFYLRGEEFTAQVDHFVDCIQQREGRNRSTFADALEADRVIGLLQRDGLGRS